MQPKQIVAFDGICNLCSRTVRFILKRDKKKKILFTPLQSELSKTILPKEIWAKTSSLVYLKEDKVYTHSTGVLMIGKDLGGIWKMFAIILLAIPRPIRDFAYLIVAHNRYWIFGKSNQCFVPSENIKERFI